MMGISYWEYSRYFIKCAHCGYEIFIVGKHTTPRRCPKCGYLMIEVKEVYNHV